VLLLVDELDIPGSIERKVVLPCSWKLLAELCLTLNRTWSLRLEKHKRSSLPKLLIGRNLVAFNAEACFHLSADQFRWGKRIGDRGLLIDLKSGEVPLLCPHHKAVTVTGCIDVTRAHELSSSDASLVKVLLAGVWAQLSWAFVETPETLITEQVSLAVCWLESLDGISAVHKDTVALCFRDLRKHFIFQIFIQ
jgi:hypothetical protein